jgi:hypothetical protein
MALTALTKKGILYHAGETKTDAGYPMGVYQLVSRSSNVVPMPSNKVNVSIPYSIDFTGIQYVLSIPSLNVMELHQTKKAAEEAYVAYRKD